MEFFDNHKKLFRTALGLFVGLTIVVAIMPAINNQDNNEPLPGYEPLSQEAYLGKKVLSPTAVWRAIPNKLEM